jgi:hypothetical protein
MGRRFVMAQPAGYKQMAITGAARQSVDDLIIALTIKYRRKFTISDALKKASDLICTDVYTKSGNVKQNRNRDAVTHHEQRRSYGDVA